VKNLKQRNFVSTFSIVGYDPDVKEWGVAVQSKFLAVGAVVPWLKAGVGAVATQSWANTTYGPDGLDMMAKGLSAEEVISRLTRDDEGRDLRQVGIIDANGNAATFTGKDCYPWAGGVTGKHYAAQGNILVSEDTVQAMASTFETATGDLAKRLLAALDAGGKAGGDSRGEQSAALVVVKEKGGYGGYNDRYIDLRVDDHVTPIAELIRVHQLYKLYFYKTKRENIITIDPTLRQEIEGHLLRTGYLTNAALEDIAFNEALQTYYLTENFDERITPEGMIDREVLEFMRKMESKN
jgi:uncharacterized Ntn-hydrolase superfamily protein